MKEVEIVLNPSMREFAKYRQHSQTIEVSFEFQRLEDYEKYFISRFLINKNYFERHNIIYCPTGIEAIEYNKKCRKFADELALIQTMKNHNPVNVFHIKLLYETKREFLDKEEKISEILSQMVDFQQILLKVCKTQNFIRIRKQSRSIWHKVKMFFNRFRVLDKGEAEKLNLVFLKNIHGDQINHLNCRSIWLDANMNEYRVKNYI